eukprot:6179090-Pleurochrysis_carterae.AAC.1
MRKRVSRWVGIRKDGAAGVYGERAARVFTCLRAHAVRYARLQAYRLLAACPCPRARIKARAVKLTCKQKGEGTCNHVGCSLHLTDCSNGMLAQARARCLLHAACCCRASAR